MKIGIDPEREPELLHLAKEGLMQALPPDWKVCYNDKIQATYYYNKKTLVTQWDHPLDAIYRNIVEDTRRRLLKEKKSDVTSSLPDNSEEVSQLDSGIRSLQGNEEFNLNPPNNKPTIIGFKKNSGNQFSDMKRQASSGSELIRTSRFEVVKTNPEISLRLDGNHSLMTTLDLNSEGFFHDERDNIKKGFTITGTGAMFLKSNMKKSDDYTAKNYFTETFISNVKGILRDSSLTDVRKRLDDTDTEDKKSVRFNLDEIKLSANYSPDASSSKKFGPSPEASDNSDEDPWDFLENDQQEAEKRIKEVTVISGMKPTNLKGLKSQNATDQSIEAQNRTGMFTRKLSADSSSMLENSKKSIIETRKFSDQNPVKPLYDDTDSESKDCSIRSFLQNPTIGDDLPQNSESRDKNDYDDIRKEHERTLETLKRDLEAEREEEMKRLRDEMQKELVNKRQEILQQFEEDFINSDVEKTKRELRKIAEKTIEEEKAKIEIEIAEKTNNFKQQKQAQNKELLEIEEITLEKSFQRDFQNIKELFSKKINIIQTEYDAKLEDIRCTLEEEQIHKLEEYRIAVQEEFHSKRQQILNEHKATVDILQRNHSELVQELERDLKSEEEILRKEHQTHLLQMRDKLALELEAERQRMRENGEDRLYEKVRCEKRLLEDKYRCLKEKYIRLKTDVRITLERRQKKREQQAQQVSITTTGSATETDRSTSNKPSVDDSENRSTPLPVPHTTDPAKPYSLISKGHLQEKASESPSTRERKATLASKYIKQFQTKHQEDTTSISQSDTTMSNNYSKGKYLPSPYSDNGNSDSEAFNRNQENNNFARDRQRKKLFSRMKSASTSRLNSDNFKVDRPCTPVENLRSQLQKLDDLEDQFPDNTLETTYHLRYPFSDISNEHAGGSSELEFFKHRIHLERDSVRRAKESLRTQRMDFRSRQREIKQRHKVGNTRHTLDQLVNEERELTEMEVNLHRTRALLGEKVIRLRHLEQSLQRLCEKENPGEYQQTENKDDATTLSDLSSHSSSGFSSTDLASENIHRRKDIFQEPSECIQSLEILNAEIREFLDILGNKQTSGLPASSQMMSGDLNWSILAQNIQQTATVPSLMHAPQSITTLADRLETYRQLAAGRVQNSVGSAILAANTIVSQSPRAVNYTTNLVERTRDLRNWLRQAKNEHDILSTINFGGNLAATTNGQQTNL
ncbi:unnamed protein product [Hermetia illucens]|uniref:WW domain-containing protein n=2 Tax=Hermetia illucens TaxID=343691 RepID=A0A7R8UV83_HERIL|nr:centrosomal protein of 164 kDa isoform X2 [Hermetia illucens]XP_037916795.1 centrosomal protein of 164 kDa isoform X2 [Hermetia illucens]CAD7087750.1 unnamed protein product [Hermetia illucens]